jgi:phosphate-selective porin OprO/OprP
MTWSCVWFRPDLGSSSNAFFGDGQAGFQARLTGLPVYEDEGRHLLHVGLSGGWRNGTVVSVNLAPFHTLQLQARPEMRDQVPGGGTLNGNSNRMVDTGLIATDTDWLMGFELLYIRGPLSLQGEYGWNWIDNAVGILPSAVSTALVPLTPHQNYVFTGGYVQVAYTLTGEHRAYDKRGGALAREYLGKQGPYNRAWVCRDADGNWMWNTGAWEIAARYSRVDLNDGVGLNRIQGGIMDGVSVALNWYLNNNLTVNFDWVYDNRYDLPMGVLPGHTNGFGSRVQFQF